MTTEDSIKDDIKQLTFKDDQLEADVKRVLMKIHDREIEEKICPYAFEEGRVYGILSVLAGILDDIENHEDLRKIPVHDDLMIWLRNMVQEAMEMAETVVFDHELFEVSTEIGMKLVKTK